MGFLSSTIYLRLEFQATYFLTLPLVSVSVDKKDGSNKWDVGLCFYELSPSMFLYIISRLTLPGRIVEDGREKAKFDIDKGKSHYYMMTIFIQAVKHYDLLD